MEQDRKPREKSCTYGHLSLTKEVRIYNREKAASLISGAGKTGQLLLKGASLVAQMVKDPPAMWETWVQFLGWKDSPAGGHSNPFQYSCLEIPMDRGTWRGTIHGVTMSWTQLSD